MNIVVFSCISFELSSIRQKTLKENRDLLTETYSTITSTHYFIKP